MPAPGGFDIELEEVVGQNALIDVPALVEALGAGWHNRTLAHVNDALVRIGTFEGEFPWHVHDEQDEMFLVLEGTFLLDVEGVGTLPLGRHQGYVVPLGVRHRPRAPERAVVLMVEQRDVRPTGD